MNSAKWARLGDLNIDSTDDDAMPKDYRIIQHVLHPDYKPTERYNDIALLLLESNVEFSKYVRPACLNTDQSLNPPELIATGWGRTATGLFLYSYDNSAFVVYVHLLYSNRIIRAL